MKYKILTAVLFILLGFGLTACTSADIASRNLSKEADMFRVNRRVVFYNGITNEYILVIEGYCSLGNYDVAGEVSITCEVGENNYKKHFLGLSDNVTYFAEQLDSEKVSEDAYKVIFKPRAIIPDIEVDL
jgi:hypothetical protein